jgi:hypothetical protein
MVFSKLPIDNGLFRPYKLLKSIGIEKFIQPSNLSKFLKQAATDYLGIIQDDKKQLLTFEIFNVRVGDLLYDWHLRERLLDTVDLHSQQFKTDFLFFMCNFYWWNEYLETNNVDSIFISHSCIDLAMPARIAMRNGSKAYVAAWSKIYKLDQGKLFSDLEFIDYDPNKNEQFNFKINSKEARTSLNSVKNRETTINAYSLGSGYDGKCNEKIVKNPDKLNILIATHCFSDPPHSYGDMLFEDFKEWLLFIGEMSRKLNYNFYIKPHPAFWESDYKHFRNFLREYPNIIEIPTNYSNLELFSQGIKVVLTVYGTIAFEAADEGILVINASRISPHMNYNFSKHPQSIEEFKKLLFEIPVILKDWQIDLSEIEHFFALHHLRKKHNLMFGNKTFEFFKYIGGAGEQYLNPLVFDFWLNNLPQKHRVNIKKQIEIFLKSNDYTLF